MLAVQGYYDGVTIKPLEKITAKPNQRVIITIMDEFVEPVAPVRKKRMRGVLAQYAKPELREKEKGAWARAVVEKYGAPFRREGRWLTPCRRKCRATQAWSRA